MKRREFITLLGGAAAGWPFAARAQQSMRRVAVIMVTPETDPVGQRRLTAFVQGFEKLGWTEGRNAQFDIRWAGGSAERMGEIVAEIVGLKPDVIVANGTPTVAALKRATSTIPVVLVGINEPVVQGFIASLCRVAGCATPTCFAGHASAMSNSHLTFHLGHSVGSVQSGCKVRIQKI